MGFNLALLVVLATIWRKTEKEEQELNNDDFDETLGWSRPSLGTPVHDEDDNHDKNDDLKAILAWSAVVCKYRRLAFKRRSWSFLGTHLRDIKVRGR